MELSKSGGKGDNRSSIAACTKPLPKKCVKKSCQITHHVPNYDLEHYVPIYCKECPDVHNSHKPACNHVPLVFRTSRVMERGKISLKNAIVINSKSNIIHTELTSRSLVDGEGFKLVGNTREVGVGVCVETCHLEKKFQSQWYSNCVSFFGTETTMRATNQAGAEYEVEMYRDPDRHQGFTYNKHGNCVTHIGDHAKECYDLPHWFNGKHLRAIGFVWNSNYAKIDNTCTTPKPSTSPLLDPTQHPSTHPTHHPTPHPTRQPTHPPTPHPTPDPTHHPSPHPTHYPSPHPTHPPTHPPTPDPTHHPSSHPTHPPTPHPTHPPTPHPTPDPTHPPTPHPTHSPTPHPTHPPTPHPTPDPTHHPSPNTTSNTRSNS